MNVFSIFKSAPKYIFDLRFFTNSFLTKKYRSLAAPALFLEEFVLLFCLAIVLKAASGEVVPSSAQCVQCEKEYMRKNFIYFLLPHLDT